MTLVRSIELSCADVGGEYPSDLYDLSLNRDALARRLRGVDEIARLRRKLDRTTDEVLHQFTPSVFRDKTTGEVDLNNGYDPDEDEGRLEAMIWQEVKSEVSARLIK